MYYNMSYSSTGTLLANAMMYKRRIKDNKDKRQPSTTEKYGWWALILKDKTSISTETNLV